MDNRPDSDQDHLAVPDRAKACRKCGGAMKPSKAMGQTSVALRPARGPDDVRTFYAGGTGKLIDCLKCEACGWSVAAGASNGPNDTMIAAADQHADNYEEHDIPARDVRAAITNAFYAGAKWQRSSGASDGQAVLGEAQNG